MLKDTSVQSKTVKNQVSTTYRKINIKLLTSKIQNRNKIGENECL